jgi:hypothetical protein
MKLQKIRYICFEEGLKEQDLLIDFLMKAIPKVEVDYQYYEYDIDEGTLINWIKRFQSGNPIKEMNQTEKKKLVSIIIKSINGGG